MGFLAGIRDNKSRSEYVKELVVSAAMLTVACGMLSIFFFMCIAFFLLFTGNYHDTPQQHYIMYLSSAGLANFLILILVIHGTTNGFTLGKRTESQEGEADTKDASASNCDDAC